MAITWFPAALGELDNWYVEFVIQCNNYKIPLATVLTSGVLTQVAANRDLIIACKQAIESSKHYQRDIVHYTKIAVRSQTGAVLPVTPVSPPAMTIPSGAIPAIADYTFGLVRQIKAHPAYTPAMGAAMGILPGTVSTGQPKVIPTAQGGSAVKLSLLKARHQAVAVFLSVNGGPWTQLAVATKRTYIDHTAPQTPGTTEVRTYKVQGYDNGSLVGPESSTAAVATIP